MRGNVLLRRHGVKFSTATPLVRLHTHVLKKQVIWLSEGRGRAPTDRLQSALRDIPHM